MAPVTARAPRETAAVSKSATKAETIVRELAAVADYVARIKQEIEALKVNELRRHRIPAGERRARHGREGDRVGDARDHRGGGRDSRGE